MNKKVQMGKNHTKGGAKNLVTLSLFTKIIPRSNLITKKYMKRHFLCSVSVLKKSACYLWQIFVLCWLILYTDGVKPLENPLSQCRSQAPSRENKCLKG